MSGTHVIDDIFSSPENGVPKKLIITKDKAEDYPMGSLSSHDTDTDDNEDSSRKSTIASSSSSSSSSSSLASSATSHSTMRGRLQSLEQGLSTSKLLWEMRNINYEGEIRY